MILTKSKFIDLHINSTINELESMDAHIDIDHRLIDAKTLLERSPNTPGLIITCDGDFHSFISRKELFEILSKPFGLELFSKRPIRFLMESNANKNVLLLHSATTVVEAAQKALERPEETFDDPIIIEFDNGRLKLLNSYNLLLAHLHINSLALKALKEANELKSEILSIAAHDLKNPLSAILGFSSLIKGLVDEPNSEIIEMSEMIHNSADHMLNLIMDLLNTTTIETGKMNYNMHYIDVSDIVMALVYQNKNLADKKEQVLDLRIEKDKDMCIYGDAVKIREAFENIISNAIKYSPFYAKIIIELKSTNNNIILKVIDQGPGISSEDMQKLFGKFQRLTAQPTGGETSTGLGLYICKQIIESHEGKIMVESALGSGSTFIIQIPSVDIDNI